MENFGKNNKLSLFKSKQSDAENVFGKSTKTLTLRQSYSSVSEELWVC